MSVSRTGTSAMEDLAIFLTTSSRGALVSLLGTSRRADSVRRRLEKLGASVASAIVPMSKLFEALEIVQDYGVKSEPRLLRMLPAPSSVVTWDDAMAVAAIRFPDSVAVRVRPSGGILPSVTVSVKVHRVKDWRRSVRALRRELARKVYIGGGSVRVETL